MPRPVFYGMLFAQQFVGGRIVVCPLHNLANVSAHQWLKDGRTLMAAANKEEMKLPILLKGAKRWELTGLSLDAKTGVSVQTAGLPVAGSAVSRWRANRSRKGSR